MTVCAVAAGAVLGALAGWVVVLIFTSLTTRNN